MSPDPPLLSLKRFACASLEPFDLSLAAGECVSLSGPSGSGKTRLLRAVADLDPHAGQCAVEGTDQSSLSGPAWRQRVALLLAESAWWAERVAAHFPEGQPDATDLAAVGLDAAARTWPVARLSSGERQRLALLRALAVAPRVLLLDEPTANLDTDTAALVEARVKAWREHSGGTCIWASHDRAQRLRVATRHLHISAGRVTAADRP